MKWSHVIRGHSITTWAIQKKGTILGTILGNMNKSVGEISTIVHLRGKGNQKLGRIWST